jgi:hypothetical protein
MLAPRLAAFVALAGGALLFLFALLGSALLGVSSLADWTLGGAAACFWLAISIFLGYFFAGCVRDFRKTQ